MTENTRTSVMTPECILAFHDLFRAKAIEEGKEPTFNATLLFSPEVQQTPDFAAMKAAATAAAQKRFAQEIAADPQFVATLRNPFRRCEEKPKYYADLGPGWLFINVSTKQRPGVVKPVQNGVAPITDENEIYAGVVVRATISPFAYPQPGAKGPAAANKGVSFGLGNVLKVRDGERRGGRPSAQDDFGAIVKANPAAASTPAESLF